MTGHRSSMQCRDPLTVFRIRVEAAREHSFEDRSVAAFGRHLQHEMMLCPKFAAQIGVGLQHCVGARTVAACTGR
jgi:hypothetical protein